MIFAFLLGGLTEIIRSNKIPLMINNNITATTNTTHNVVAPYEIWEPTVGAKVVTSYDCRNTNYIHLGKERVVTLTKVIYTSGGPPLVWGDGLDGVGFGWVKPFVSQQ